MSALDISQFAAGLYATEEARSDSDLAWNLGDYIDHWSPSSLDTFRRCPYQWQRKKIWKRIERPAEAPVLGTTVHAALERNFKQKIDSGVDIPLADLVEWYTDVGFFQTVTAEQERAGEEVEWKDTSAEDARQRGRLMVAAYHHNVAERIQPLAVETEVSVDLGAPVPVIGRFDLEHTAGVIDWKTGKRKSSKPRESWRIQAAVYSEAQSKSVEFHVIACSLERHTVSITTPLEEPALLVQLSRAERAETRLRVRAISAEACMYMDRYGPDLPWPTHGRWHDWACDACGFRADCPAWKED